MIPNCTNETLELFITEKCNMACHNCDAMVRQAPGTNMLTIDQIDHFIDEARMNNINWKVIMLTGGEALTHPNIIDIIRKLNEAFFPGGVQYCEGVNHTMSEEYWDWMVPEQRPITEGLILLTNGKKKHKLIELFSRSGKIFIINTNKQTNNQYFYPVNIAPKDNPNFDADKTEDYAHVQKICQCSSPCLTPSGYYPCTAGATLDRVFGIDAGIQKLSDVNEQNIYKQFEKLCTYCGYFNEIAPFDVPEEHITPVTHTIMSSSWMEATAKYKITKPVLSKYAGQKMRD